MTFPDWIASLPQGDLEIISAGFPFDRSLVRAPVIDAPRVLAGAVGRIAMDRWTAGLAQDPAAIDANYVRRSDAELMWKDPGA